MSRPAAAQGTPAAPLRAFTEELVAAGVRDVVVCPGSRSTPMALALAMHPALRLLVDLDERGAGFLALGLAKASRRPVARARARRAARRPTCSPPWSRRTRDACRSSC